jgi:hypothetical protein
MTEKMTQKMLDDALDHHCFGAPCQMCDLSRHISVLGQEATAARQKIQEAQAWTYDGDMVVLRQILNEAMFALMGE